MIYALAALFVYLICLGKFIIEVGNEPFEVWVEEPEYTGKDINDFS